MAYRKTRARCRPGGAGLVAAVLAIAIGVSACGGSSSPGTTTPSKESNTGLSTPTGLVSSGILTFGTDFNYPPYEYIKNGKDAGFDYQLGTEIAKVLGLIPKFTNLQFATLINGVQSGQVDVGLSAIYVSKQRVATVNMIPYATAGLTLITKSGGSYQPTTAQQLCGHTVAVGASSPLIQYAASNGPIGKVCPAGKPITVKPFSADALMYSDVLAGRSAVAANDSAVANYELPHYNGQLKITLPQGTVFTPAPLGVAVAKNKTSIYNAVKAALAKLQTDGFLPALLKKYRLAPASQELFERVSKGENVPPISKLGG